MDVQKALLTLREAYRKADGNYCPKHEGIYFNLCDSTANCNPESCWLLAITLFIKGEIESE